jgi:hypothetical protein
MATIRVEAAAEGGETGADDSGRDREARVEPSSTP